MKVFNSFSLPELVSAENRIVYKQHKTLDIVNQRRTRSDKTDLVYTTKSKTSLH